MSTTKNYRKKSDISLAGLKPEDFRPISKEAMGKSLQNVKAPPVKGKK